MAKRIIDIEVPLTTEVLNKMHDPIVNAITCAINDGYEPGSLVLILPKTWFGLNCTAKKYAKKKSS